MKRLMFGKLVLFAVLVLALAGCPPRHTCPPDPSGSGQYNNPPVANPLKTGSFTVSGNQYDSDSTKSMTYADSQRTGNALKAMAVTLVIDLAEYSFGKIIPTIEDGQYIASPEKGGGPATGYRHYVVPVSGGDYYGRFDGIPVGSYAVYTAFLDYNGYVLFEGYASIDIEENVVKPLTVIADFCVTYQFCFTITGLPGIYADESSFLIVPFVEGQLGGGDNYVWLSIDQATGNFVVHATLPLNFDGGTILFSDINGAECKADVAIKPYQVVWDSFQFGQLLNFPFVPSVLLGGVDLTVELGYEHKIWANGQYYSDLQSAIDYSQPDDTGVVNIGIPAGIWRIYTVSGTVIIPPGKSVSIVGSGADTILESYGTARHVIYASAFGGPYPYDNNGMGKSAKGGGSYSAWNISLRDLHIRNMSVLGQWYSDAAVFVEGIDNVSIDNCIITSGNRAISANYYGDVRINHCDLVGDPLMSSVAAIELSYGSDTGVSFKNSIVRYFPTVVVCDRVEAIGITYSCIFDYAVISNQPGLAIINSIFADPLWDDSTFQLLPGSPCLYAGEGGTNIGMGFKG